MGYNVQNIPYLLYVDRVCNIGGSFIKVVVPNRYYSNHDVTNLPEKQNHTAFIIKTHGKLFFPDLSDNVMTFFF